ncbi:MAG: VWA domain-containing protein [Deltaproteobacteria bacterium]|nr:VWA domain-containing protein [Deltaproteobacteria bacterium]MBK8239927.1 VWA domain-containing protein [Deltaproteobacteria bacterium]MBK8716088.1 VWA domain-containing protein [Deltaproteobacteria bacterium]MBP7286839.1 VWA domain-containing protein [Nannocystaceae bacterium]
MSIASAWRWAEPPADLTVRTLDAIDWGRLDWWWAALAVPLAIGAVLWGARQRARARAALGQSALVTKLLSSVHTGNRVLQSVFAIAGLSCVAVALLRPQYGGKANVVPASGLDIVIAVDYSKSMLAADVYPSRSERLEAELARFLDDAARRGDRIGVVVFAGAARGFPVTADIRLLKTYLQAADPRREKPGGTAIGRALTLALTFLVDARRGDADDLIAADGTDETKLDDKTIPPAENDQAIVLLTDGEDTESRPMEVAKEAARLGVRVYTVGIGSKSGEPVQKFDDEGNPDGYITDEQGNYVMTRIDAELLEEIAKTTGGRFVHVDPEHFGLDAVRQQLEGLSRSRREVTIEILRDEGYSFFVIPAVLLLTLALALPQRRRRADPR